MTEHGEEFSTHSSKLNILQMELTQAVEALPLSFWQVRRGGGTINDQVLKAWTEAGSYELTSVTYDGTHTSAISTATVKWPDTSGGTFTSTTINSTWGKVDAYTITHTLSGKTVTQTAVTRDANGLITTKPALTVA
jgi:hypothetical protein